MNDTAQHIRDIASLGFDPADIVKGCESCSVTPQIVRNAARVARAAYVLRILAPAGDPLPVRGWYRCSDCNARRGGAARSRHLDGSAIDVDSVDSRDVLRNAARVLDWAGWQGSFEHGLPRLIRAISGLRNFIGVKFYSSGRGIHIDLGCHPDSTICDPRRADWTDIEVAWA